VTDPALSRRRALMGAAVGGLSLPLLAACGGGGASSTAQPPTSGAGSSSPGGGSSSGSGRKVIPLVATSQVPVGGGVILANDNVVVTQPTQGTFACFSATCTHAGCPLASVAGGTINCSCHGSQFSIKDGSNVTGPMGMAAGSVPPLPRYRIKVQGSEVVAT
jgi:nitrite reductase/ring-hydroxylating ferredoxin subunit